MTAVLSALVRPVVTCLVAGSLKVMLDYQANPRWSPALVDGAITALVTAASILGIGGAVLGVRSVAPTFPAAKSPPP